MPLKVSIQFYVIDYFGSSYLMKMIPTLIDLTDCLDKIKQLYDKARKLAVRLFNLKNTLKKATDSEDIRNTVLENSSQIIYVTWTFTTNGLARLTGRSKQ